MPEERKVRSEQHEPLFAPESISCLWHFFTFLLRLSPSTSQRNRRDTKHSTRTPEGTQAPGMPHAHNLLSMDKAPPQQTPNHQQQDLLTQQSLTRMGVLSLTQLVVCKGLTPRCTTHSNKNLCLANIPPENKGHTVWAQHQRGETKTTARGRSNNTVNKEEQSQQSQTGEKKHGPREAQQRESRSQSHALQPHQPHRCQEQPGFTSA